MSWSRQTVVICACWIVCSSFSVETKYIQDNEITLGGGCLVNGVSHKVGDSWPGPVGECMVYKCRGHDGSYSGLTCPLVAVRPESGCFIVPGNNKVQYPKCCPQAFCPVIHVNHSRNH